MLLFGIIQSENASPVAVVTFGGLLANTNEPKKLAIKLVECLMSY